jgi:hypothetical protein
LAHLGAENLISEHAIVRAHDRCQPLLIKMFASSNFGTRSFNATETMVGHTILFRYRIMFSGCRSVPQRAGSGTDTVQIRYGSTKQVDKRTIR